MRAGPFSARSGVPAGKEAFGGAGLCLRFTGGFDPGRLLVETAGLEKESGQPWFADSRFLSNFGTESLWRRFHGKS